MTVFHWFILSSLLFSIGVYGLLTRRNAVGVLMAVELMLNSAALNFVVFNHFLVPVSIEGELMAIFIIAVAAAEVLIALAIFVVLLRRQKTMDVTAAKLLRGDLVSTEPAVSFSEFVPFLSASLGEVPKDRLTQERENS